MKTLLFVAILSATLLDCGLCYTVAVFYVKPTGPSTECPSGDSPCHSLQYYANHSTFTNNSRFLFLEGEHHLDSVVAIRNVANLSLVGASSGVKIICKSLPSGFHFEEFTRLSIKNMVVSNCRSASENATLYLRTGSEVSLNHMTITNTSGFYATGLVAVDVVGDFSVSDSSFIAPQGGNILVNYSLCTKPSYFNFSNNRVITEFIGTGLIQVYSCSNVMIAITDSFLENYWDNMALYMTFNVAMNNSAFVNDSIFGGDMYISTCDFCDRILQCYSLSSSNIITLARITISNDSTIQYYTSVEDCNILIEDSLFFNLSMVLVIALTHGPSYRTSYDKYVEAILRNVTFLDNRGRGPIVSLNQASMLLVDCIFENNVGTAIATANSRVILQGSNTFKNNSAVSGGGIQLHYSYMYLQPYSQVLFEDNHADLVGGAIYTDSKGPDPCFFHAAPNSSVEVNVNFYGNSAKYAGSSVYGGVNRDTKSCEFFHDIFNISNTETDPSAIASDPFQVCFCDGDKRQPDCKNRNRSIHAFPGQGFALRLAVVGGGIFDGVVPGTIRAYFNSSDGSLGYFHSSQASNVSYCSNFTYAVNSNARRMATLILTPEQNFFHLISGNYSLLTVRVYFLDCPLGFTVSPTGKCDCDPLIDKTILCDINDRSFLRPVDSNSWFGFIKPPTANSNATGVISYPTCPGYCTSHAVRFTVNTSDSQCAPHRTGLLCGKCEEDYSLTLGNANCVKCPNTYLLLVLPFAIAGLLLVAILFLLNITVTEGSINGLIFYANIIEMNRAVLFTGGSHYLYKTLAWWNLDLGFSICLFNGMDGYTETWLQFLFPFYLWIIILGIILFYNKFPVLANRLGGENAVKVLATLLLLSYTKLQRTIITIMSYARLDYPSGEVRYVWLYDANLDYFSSKHLYLGIAGILVLVFLIVPYTLCLTFFQQLQACSGHKPFQWVNKLKPVFDAYAGPYKDKYRFWTGMLLVVRTLLIILFAITSSSSQSADLNLLIISVVSCALLLANTNGVYKNWLCNYLESYFYVQLIVFSVGVTYAKHIDGNVTAVTETSFGLSLAVFLVILGYHIRCRIAAFRHCYQCGYNHILEEELSVNHVRIG